MIKSVVNWVNRYYLYILTSVISIAIFVIVVATISMFCPSSVRGDFITNLPRNTHATIKMLNGDIIDEMIDDIQWADKDHHMVKVTIIDPLRRAKVYVVNKNQVQLTYEDKEITNEILR